MLVLMLVQSQAAATAVNRPSPITKLPSPSPLSLSLFRSSLPSSIQSARRLSLPSLVLSTFTCLPGRPPPPAAAADWLASNRFSFWRTGDMACEGAWVVSHRHQKRVQVLYRNRERVDGEAGTWGNGKGGMNLQRISGHPQP